MFRTGTLAGAGFLLAIASGPAVLLPDTAYAGSVATQRAPAVVPLDMPARTVRRVGRRGRLYVILDVTGYTPPRSGRVEAVVKLDGPRSREIGRFGLYPSSSAYTSTRSGGPQRFQFPIGSGELASSGRRPKLRIDLMPGRTASGARLTVGRAMVERK